MEQNTINSTQLIDEKEAARILCYTVRALQNWRCRGGGPKFIKVSSRSVRYSIQDLNEWIEARKISNTAQYVA